MQVNLKGVGDATRQTLADQAYVRFVAQLRAAGREVITPADGQWDYGEYKRDSAPTAVEFFQAKGRAFSPKAIPLWAQIGDPWGGVTFDQTNYKAMGAASFKAGAPRSLAPRWPSASMALTHVWCARKK